MNSIANQVVERINQNYELDQAFVEAVRQYIIEAIANQTEEENENADISAKARAPQKTLVVKNTRAPSAYARFVKAVYPELKDIPPKQRMVEAGKRWRALSKTDQAKY